MNWARAIERNREALLGIVAALFARLRLQGGATAGLLSRRLHSAVLRVLRPAESAMRRLIVIAARGLVVKLSPARPMPVGPIRLGSTSRVRFQLFDPRIRLAPERSRTGPRPIPRIHVFTSDPRVAALWPASPPTAEPASPPPDGSVNGEALCRRLEALRLALDDLPPGEASRPLAGKAREDARPEVCLSPSSGPSSRPLPKGPFTRSITCSPNAIGSPSTPRSLKHYQLQSVRSSTLVAHDAGALAVP